ncbi:hypothetical protein GCM10011418_15660 [Sphingobacterium alkalisoli]|nr:hypothetical protein GCM10011418_15660 [Sphingobacterium alkalisoli]
MFAVLKATFWTLRRYFGQLQVDFYALHKYFLSMQNLYKRRKIVAFSFRTGLALLSGHFVLSYGEPEGFFEIFYVEGFVLQFAYNVLGFFFCFG